MLDLVSVFSDNAIFQQKAVTDLRGFTDPHAIVTATLKTNGVTVGRIKATADAKGRFTLPILGEEASFVPYELTLENGKDKVTLHDILFGDVYLACGQSNMTMTVHYMPERDEILQRVASHSIRCYVYDHDFLPTGPTFSQEPLENAPGHWCRSDDRADFENATAVGAYAAIRIAEALQKEGKEIPIAMLSLNLGGTNIKAWMPESYIVADPDMLATLRRMKHYTEKENWNLHPAPSGSEPRDQQSALYNTVIAPTLGMKARAMLWYQGEANAWNPHADKTYKQSILFLQRSYADLFAVDATEFPLLCSLLYPFPYGEDGGVRLGNVNRAMVNAAIEHPDKIAVTPIHDLPPRWSQYYTYHPIHPTNKENVGYRLGDLLMVHCYGQKGLPSAPYCKKVTRRGNTLILRFETFRRSLSCKGNKLRGFYLCGKNGVYTPAEAEIISRSTVKVWHPYIPSPRHVAYTLSDMDREGNLFCENLPAAPFTTEDSSKLTVIPKPWLDPSQTAFFYLRGKFIRNDLFYYPTRRSLPGTELCYDSAYDATRLLLPESKNGGVEIRAERTMPLDLHNYRGIKFDFYGREETKVTVRITLKKKAGENEEEQTVFRSYTPTLTACPPSDRIEASFAFRLPSDATVEKLSFLFDGKAAPQPAAIALGKITLIPKQG